MIEGGLGLRTYGERLITRLAAVVQRQSGKVFAHILGSSGTVELTYGRLWAESRACAAYYRENGLAQGDVLVLMLRPGTSRNYSAFVGAMMEGIMPAFMPLPSPKQPPEVYWPTHKAVLGRNAVKAVLTDREHAFRMREHLPGLALSVLTVEGIESAEATPIAQVPPRASNPAFLQHSSGTTGVKKGVCLAHEIVLAQIDAYADVLGFDENSRVSSWLPLYHDMGLITSFLMPMSTGASVVVVSPFDWLIDPAAWLNATSQYRCTHAWMPNFAFMHLARLVQADPHWELSRLRWINCSEPCKAEAFQLFQAAFASVGVHEQAFSVCYAMAENVFAVTQTRSEGMPRRLKRGQQAPPDPGDWRDDSAIMGGPEMLSCGYPLPGVEIQIWDQAKQPLPDGQMGEIVIRGPYLFSEYHDDPVTTSSRFHDGWFLTHDLGLMNAGELFVSGRVDDLINLYGRKVYAHEVESIAAGVPGILPGRIVAIGHDSLMTGSQELILLAEMLQDMDEKAVKRAVKLEVEAKLGVTVAKVELFGKGWLIKTTSGKISRYLNHRKYMAMRADR